MNCLFTENFSIAAGTVQNAKKDKKIKNCNRLLFRRINKIRLRVA